MATIRRTFTKGVMNKDVDERLLDDGYYRHAENIIINTSEGSDVGAIEKCLSNKQLTNINLGSNIKTLGTYSDESKNKLYWFVISSSGCRVFEYDYNSKTLYTLLHDSRVTKVLNFKRANRITGISKIISEDTSKDMLLWTDNNMEVCCINIERAKTFGVNGFQKEDIYLIKKPPKDAPTTRMTYAESKTNNIEDKFISFAYRYKYLDGEYSALSPLSYYSFEPESLKIDFDTLENVSMINKYNAVEVSFSTGDKRVVEIQLLAKASQSNNVYIIENFNKEKQSWGHNLIKSFIYSNNKLYKVLPEKELFKQFDNVPKRAKALATFGNRVFLGNYTEGYDLKDANGVAVNLNYQVGYSSLGINKEIPISMAMYDQQIRLNPTNGAYKKGQVLSFYIHLVNKSYSPSVNGKIMIDSVFDFQLPKTYYDITTLQTDNDFIFFIENINVYIENNLENYKVNDDDSLRTPPSIVINKTSSGSLLLNLLNGEVNISDVGYGDIITHYETDTYIKLYEGGKGRSLKSNRDYEVAMIYEDEYKRSSTALTSLNNSIYIKQSESDSINKITVDIWHKPPVWAKTYRFAIKSAPLNYENIFISKYYSEDAYIWCLLEGSNKDKVKEGDNLIIKKDAFNAIDDIFRIPVLEKKTHEKDFITGNKDDDGNDIIEEAGTYIRINTNGFTMGNSTSNTKSNEVSVSKSRSGNDVYPVGRLDLFSTTTEPLAIPKGSVIQLYFCSAHYPDGGREDSILNKTYNINTDYDSLEDWLLSEILNKPLHANEGNSPNNYQNNIRIVTVGDRKYLEVTGTKRAMTGGRKGYLDLKIVIRLNFASHGVFIFETENKKDADADIFYQTSETFDIIGGFHNGNRAMQSSLSAAKVELDFFNCIAFGEGLESYKIKDNFNANSLGIDLRPTSTSIEEYSEVTRYSDITYGEPFVEGVGFNGLNSFNASLVNWKELDKTFGPILKLDSREGDLLVFQSDKVGHVLYGKDAMYNADGTSNVAKVPYVLGQYIPYAGEYGMTHAESYEREGNRHYWVDAKRGHVLRLSQNGISPITYGMEGWFKNTLTDRARADILGGYDPHTRLYNLTIGSNPLYVMDVFSGTQFSQYQISDALSYNFNSNTIPGIATIGFDIYEGAATIEAVYNGQAYVESNVSGVGELNINMLPNVLEPIVTTITPTTETASYSVTNTAPIGVNQRVVSIVLSSEIDEGLLLSNGYKWGDSTYYLSSDLFAMNGITRFEIEEGIQGFGKFPNPNTLITMRTSTNGSSTTDFDLDANEMRCLVSSVDYTLDDLETILENSIKLTPAKEGYNTDSSFEFKSGNDTIYLIWDYRREEINTDPDPDPKPIEPPSNFEVVRTNEDLIYASFIRVAPLEDVVGHELSYKEAEATEWSDPPVFIAASTAVQNGVSIPGFDKGRSYDFRVRAVGVEDGNYSEYVYQNSDVL